MNTSTRITASVMDAIIKHPHGFTMDVQTGEVIYHGIAVGGFHQEPVRMNYNYPTSPSWLQFATNAKALEFDELQELVKADITNVLNAGFIGGWVVEGTITLDIVKVFDCIACFDDATAEPFHVAKDNEQVAVGWLCPDWSNGYKEVLI